MELEFSQRVNDLIPSATVAANDKAKALKARGVDVINLTAGEPDFPTPDFIKAAGIQAIQQNKSTYTPVDGTTEIKQAIVSKLQRDNQLHYNPDQIIVSSGAKQSLFNLTQVLLQPGDEAIILAPYWVSYPAMVTLAGAKSVIISTDIQAKFKVTPAQLEAAITDKTKLLFINSPCNPTGAAYTLSELKALAEVLLKYPNILIASDEIYEYILFNEQPFANIVNACPELVDRTIIINGVSKAHAMTGWRIGYTASHPAIMKAMKKIQSQSTTCATSISQWAATAALAANKADFLPPMLEAYQQRHDYVIEQLNQIDGIQAIAAAGTFYAFFDASGLIKKLKLQNDLELTEQCLEKAHVALVPGTAFGCPNHLRLSFATSQDNLQQAFARISEMLTSIA